MFPRPERSIRIVSADGKHTAIVNTLPNCAKSPSESSRLVFHRYGNEYFLAQVWTDGQNVARNPNWAAWLKAHVTWWFATHVKTLC